MGRCTGGQTLRSLPFLAGIPTFMYTGQMIKEQYGHVVGHTVVNLVA